MARVVAAADGFMSNAHGDPRRRWRAVGFGLLMGIVILAGVEGMLRIAGRIAGKGSHSSRSRSPGGAADINPARVFLRGEDPGTLPVADSPYRFPDPLLSWSLRPSFRTPAGERFRGRDIQDLTTNRLGMRGREVPRTKGEGVTRILCLGDSVTFGFGQGVFDEDPFPRRLEAWLTWRIPSGRFEALNAGVPGYTSVQGAIRFRDELVDLRPDVVIAGFGVNEFDVAPAPDRVILGGPVWMRRLEAFLGTFAIPRALRGRLRGPDPGDRTTRVSRASADDYREAIRTILRLARDAGARALLLQSTFFWPRWQTVAGWNRDLAASTGVALVDLREVLLEAARTGPRDGIEAEEFTRFHRMQLRLAPRIPGYAALSPEEQAAFVFMVDRVHPNALGHERIAEALGGRLVEDGMVGTAGGKGQEGE